MTSDSGKGPQDDRWWLSSGAEYCAFCEGSWHAEALVYCTVCDRPICHVCVGGDMDPTGLLCADCAAEGEHGKSEED